ncbi:RNA-dependent RNA polymerase 6 [Impatiens glandulifera]|uniref:RNA-dependent RNA polymerase 6 n=1 Tax=Impatiens glandulifera TaxID=253017 RepID=UPI001FB10EBA|nr:RNA-dependent RNA polymerase 6 [Impatiens glandulifera]
MDSTECDKAMVVTQISVGGFDQHVTAKILSDYFEENIGIVWRCRLKTSSTPPESYPDFRHETKINITNKREKIEPHAFLHFANPTSAEDALNAAARGELSLSGRPLRMNMGPQNPFSLNARRRNVDPFKLPGVGLEIGVLLQKDEFWAGWRAPAAASVDFVVDPFNSMCRFLITMDTVFLMEDVGQHVMIKCNFKAEFSIREIIIVKQYRDISSLIILLQLASSPSIYYRTADDDIEEQVPLDLLDDDDPWIRTSDFTASGVVGRCNTYRVSIPPRYGSKLSKIIEYLKEQSVPNEEGPTRGRLMIRDEPNYGKPFIDPFFCIHYEIGLSFDVLFLVNAVVHKGIISQHQLSAEFFDLLRMHSRDVSIAALKNIYTYRSPVFDAAKKLRAVVGWLIRNPKLLESPKSQEDVVEIRRLVITPVKAYCLPPIVELSNRVLRNYKDVSDRFLRVMFMDEGMQTLNSNALNYYSAPIVKELTGVFSAQKTSIFKRIKSILSDGFYLCGRRYSFLAFSANQLRDRSAWFFAEDKITTKIIKSWMGRFSNKNVAKCAARMGQCFSSTYATIEVLPYEVNDELPDIERNGYNFSDGIGMITPDLAMEVAEKLQLKVNPPSAYQIRYAGCKGVVASWPGKNDGIRLSLRPSMIKFESNHTMLEICSWTRFQPGYLNRQIITLLSTLDVADDVFWNMQQLMIYKLDQMLVDVDVAFDVLTTSCTDQGNTAAIMLSSGFMPQTEPHLRGILNCVRAAQLWGLREKTRIFVESGRWLMGCLDELGILEQGQCFIQISSPSLENCFINHGDKFCETKKNLNVITGLVVIAKNPCLHPGDVRILEAVDVPELHHLYDCLIFPQKGDRPHTNEASGSDLDGDLYFVTWDENLIPPSKRSWPPMDYEPPPIKVQTRDVTQKDIINFFTHNMVNESLGAICNSHVVHADMSEYGAQDEKCIKLAELAAIAVDFPKTGKIVTMPHKLRPQLYPDFMGKDKFQTYKSKKVIGRLYRHVKNVYEKDIETCSDMSFNLEDIPYDKELEISGSEEFIEEALKLKCSYDGKLSALLSQYKVTREEEIVTGHIWSMPKYVSRKRGDLQEKLRHIYSALRKEFRQQFENLGPEFDIVSVDEKNSIYERKASAWYQVTYHLNWVKMSLEWQNTSDNEEKRVMLSFCWIATDYLSKIKIRSRGRVQRDSCKPVNNLAKFLADGMGISK